MANLYELSAELIQLQSMLEDDSVDPEVLKDTMEAVSGEYELKMENYCKIIKNITSDISGIDDEIKRLQARKSTLNNNIKSLKDRMFESMKATNTPKIKGELFTIAIQKNGGVTPIELDVADTSELPDELVRVTEAADLDAIRKILESGEPCKYAHFGERGESLRIK